MTAPTICDPWIEKLITAGRLAPGARRLTREEAAHQYNEANALTEADDDFLYTPGQAAGAARDALAVIGIEVADSARILLTDMTGGQHCWSYLIEPGQIACAIEQHRLVSGESLSATAILEALPWF
ncbi:MULTISPECIES: hypothetical protein [Mycobacteriales]|uniref:Uncharacterized protein n=1 Tax=Tsukamurella paurometabola TaxID=2061 RepID=A0ABS5NGL0_TSUPA|nr:MULTISPECIES: hypothetical protein [Mycobacteriales]MBS4103068.1 hypothetical protein [Tsukamurella paurometabola]MCZ0911068.1 hypothetical protein [Gordonia amicalis]